MIPFLNKCLSLTKNWLVVAQFIQTQPRLESIQPDQISEDMLPVPGECLDLEIETLPMRSDAEEIAKSRNQEIL